jgi:hypothetical protein
MKEQGEGEVFRSMGFSRGIGTGLIILGVIMCAVNCRIGRYMP